MKPYILLGLFLVLCNHAASALVDHQLPTGEAVREAKPGGMLFQPRYVTEPVEVTVLELWKDRR